MSLPTLNGAWAYAGDADPGAIDQLLDRVAASGVPYCLQAPAELEPALGELVARRGMTRDADVPLMVLDSGEDRFEFDAGDLRIRELAPAEYRAHPILAAAGFEVAEDYFVQLMTPELIRLGGIRSYFGEVDGEPVSTGVGFTRGDWVGIFNIATLPAHRRRGHGAAVTMRAVRDGFSDGASWAWLQSSPVGRPVYERLGFRTVAEWSCWTAPARPPLG